MELRNLIEIEIVGDDFAVVDLGQLDELHVHLADLGEILLYDLHREVSHLLDPLQDVQAAAAAVALHRIRRIRHQLQFAQNELGDHQDAIQKAGLRYIGDAAVNDDAGV